MIHSILLCLSLLFSFSCKLLEESSTVEATAPQKEGDNIRCDDVYPSVYKVGKPILKKFYALGVQVQDDAFAKKLDPLTVKVAKRFKVMLDNMVSHPEEPIDPIGFFSTIKDFETAGVVDWSENPDGKDLDIYTTKNCTTKRCDGLFQIDIQLEAKKANTFPFRDVVCKEAGIWRDLGGADFCYSIFWWTLSEDGAKCKRMGSEDKPEGNPCTRTGIPWDIHTFGYGNKAYVQALQDPWIPLTKQLNKGVWALMYGGLTEEEANKTNKAQKKYNYSAFGGYKKCAIDYIKEHKQLNKKEVSIVDVVDLFKSDAMGVESAEPQGDKPEVESDSWLDRFF